MAGYFPWETNCTSRLTHFVSRSLKSLQHDSLYAGSLTLVQSGAAIVLSGLAERLTTTEEMYLLTVSLHKEFIVKLASA